MVAEQTFYWLTPGGGKVDDILVHKTSEEFYKCEEFRYRRESEMSFRRHMSIKHPCHTPESGSDAKFFWHECNFSYKTKKSLKNHMSKIQFNQKTYNCDTREEKFTDKCEFDTQQWAQT